MFDIVSSPTRRRALFGVLFAAGVLLVSVAQRTERRPLAPPIGGDVSACARLDGAAARSCYGREVGRELAAVGAGGGPNITFSVPADSTEVTFASNDEAPPLLCELHARVGVIDAQVPSWLGWTEPLAGAAPRS